MDIENNTESDPRTRVLDRLKNWVYLGFQAVVDFLLFPLNSLSLEAAKLSWLIRLRWMAIGLFAILIIPLFLGGHLEKSNLLVFLGLIVLLFVLNLVSLLYFSESRLSVGPFAICFQLAFDLVILTGFIFITGSFESPLMGLYPLSTALGGILILGSLSLPFLILAHGILVLIQFHYLMTHPNMNSMTVWTGVLLSHVFVFCFWTVMRYLGHYLEKQKLKDQQVLVQTERQDRLRAIGALTAGFSHEFASPLNVAKLSMDRMLRSKTLDHEDKNEMLLVQQALEKCELVIKQINSSQLDKRDFIYREIDLTAVIYDVLNQWKSEHQNIHVEFNCEDIIVAYLPLLQLVQTFINLLDNACQAGGEKPIQISLKRMLVQEQSVIRLEVRDTGIGFSEETLSRLGEPFNSNKPQGNGLGLYVAGIFSESMAGRIQVRNLNPGASVLIEWPEVRLAQQAFLDQGSGELANV